MKHSDRIHQYHREDALAQVNAVVGGHLVLGVVALAANDFQFADSPHGVYCLTIAAVVFGVNATYSWDKFAMNWAVVLAYTLCTINEFFTFGLPASMLDFSERYSKGALLDGIMYMVPFIYAVVRFALVLPLVAVARYGARNSNPASIGQ